MGIVREWRARRKLQLEQERRKMSMNEQNERRFRSRSGPS